MNEYIALIYLLLQSSFSLRIRRRQRGKALLCLKLYARGRWILGLLGRKTWREEGPCNGLYRLWTRAHKRCLWSSRKRGTSKRSMWRPRAWWRPLVRLSKHWRAWIERWSEVHGLHRVHTRCIHDCLAMGGVTVVTRWLAELHSPRIVTAWRRQVGLEVDCNRKLHVGP